MPETKDRKAAIKDIDRELFHQAKVAAVTAGIPVYKWVQDAMKEKLERNKK